MRREKLTGIFRHQIGKFANLVRTDILVLPANPKMLTARQINGNHRHDEEHEKECDEKRTKICESHRFQSYFPEQEGNMVKWYVDGRDYFWAVSVALDAAALESRARRKPAALPS